MDPVTFLTYIAVILLFGVLASALAHFLKIPDVLLFILMGMGITYVQTQDLVAFDFPTSFITSIGILSLAMIVFDSTSRINLKRLDSLSIHAFRLIMTFLVVVIILLSLAMHFIFGFNIGLCILFASIMAGTAPSVILPLLGDKTSKVVDVLKLESLLNTPLTVLIPFFIADLIISAPEQTLMYALAEQIIPFLTKFVSGLGAGLLVAILLFKVIRKAYSKIYSPMAVVIAALLAFVLAEQLGGNGVLSVTTLGLFLGNVTFKEKITLLNVETVFAKSLYIMIFVLVGYVIRPLWEPLFIGKTLALYAIYLFLRYVSVHLTFFEEHSFREKMFMTLVCAKGIAVSVVAIMLSTVPISGLPLIVDIVLLFVLYSIITASIACYCKNWFLQGESAPVQKTAIPKKTKKSTPKKK